MMLVRASGESAQYTPDIRSLTTVWWRRFRAKVRGRPLLSATSHVYNGHDTSTHRLIGRFNAPIHVQSLKHYINHSRKVVSQYFICDVSERKRMEAKRQGKGVESVSVTPTWKNASQNKIT